MKKLSLVFTAIFAAGFVMAQNSATLTQSGGNQNAIIGQSGTNSAIVGQSTDDGMAQKATVSQTGTNSIVITQVETGAATGGVSIPVQTATVLQNGAGNAGTIVQNETGSGDKILSSVKLDQVGNSNTSNQATNAPQSNSGLTVIGIQTGNSNLLNQNISSGYTEYFKAEQIGNLNSATQTGSGTNADGTIYQLGNSNTATQILAGANNGYARNGMLIRQIGDDNTSLQNFVGYGYGAGNTGESYQWGNSNYALHTGNGRHFTSIVTQNGDWNSATVSQNGSASPILVDNSVELFQFANGNSAVATQEFGSSNKVKLYQAGAGAASVYQSGAWNTVKGLSTVSGFDASWAKFNSSSTLDVDQIGNNNSLSVEADGQVSVLQNNSASTTVGNVVEFAQAGGGTSVLSQVGDKNLIKLVKTGGGSADLAQTGLENKVAVFDDVFGGSPMVNGSASFGGADLDVTQFGDGNLLHLNSTSAGAIVDVMQTGMANKASVVQN